mgnify:CR=1 FL=1
MAIDTKEFRNACGNFATGVTIVTSTSKDGEVQGMTVNGFMSVSLDPALIVVSIGKNQKMHNTIKESGIYGVSVLNDGQKEISNHFAGMHNSELIVEFSSKDNIPYLTENIACFLTKVTQCIDAGDHTLFIGEVFSFEMKEGLPLMFYKGSYRNLKAIN